MSEIDTESIEYHAAILFVQAVAEDGVLSQEEAKGVEEALGGFFEGLKTGADAQEYLNFIGEEISENTDSYLESLQAAIEFFSNQNEDLRSGIYELMKDLAATDGISVEENKFFKALKPAWKL